MLKMTKLYLGHSAGKIDETREWQLAFQARNPNIKLWNPFFEGKEGVEVQKLKRGEITYQQHLMRSNYEIFVDDDIQNVLNSDGIVAEFWDGVQQIGTSSEVTWAFIFHKPIYIIGNGLRSQNHWFLKKMATRIFNTREEFEEFIAEQYEYEGQYPEFQREYQAPWSEECETGRCV
jgi:hypothetical protein